MKLENDMIRPGDTVKEKNPNMDTGRRMLVTQKNIVGYLTLIDKETKQVGWGKVDEFEKVEE